MGPLPLIAAGGFCLLAATATLFVLPLLSTGLRWSCLPSCSRAPQWVSVFQTATRERLNIQPGLAGTAAGLAGLPQTTACACATAIVAALTLESALPIAGVWLACTLLDVGWAVAALNTDPGLVLSDCKTTFRFGFGMRGHFAHAKGSSMTTTRIRSSGTAATLLLAALPAAAQD